MDEGDLDCTEEYSTKCLAALHFFDQFKEIQSQ